MKPDKGMLGKFSFNGAIAFQRWKPDERPGDGVASRDASMEPSPFSDGNTKKQVGYLVGLCASMEPSPFSDGNSYS